MYCKFCGKYIGKKYYCNNCFNYIYDDNHISWSIMGFIIPVLGIFLYMLWKNTKPKTSLRILKWSIISFFIIVLLSITSVFFS